MSRSLWTLASIALLACGSPAAPSEPPPSTTVGPPTPAPAPAPAPTSTPTPAPTPAPATAPATAPRVRLTGFDVRATFWNDPLFVLSRTPAPDASGEGEPLGDDTEMDTLMRWPLGPPSGEPVRVVGADGVCDGTLGPRVRIEAPWLDTGTPERAAIAHEVVGCPGPASFAIVSPTPDAPWPEALAPTDPAAVPVIDAARAAATTLARGTSVDAFDARAFRLDARLYGLASGPSGSALVVVEPGQAPRTLIARPVHFPWDDPDAAYATCGVVDVDGDGAVELCERMTSYLGSMIRLVRPGEHRAGDVVWRVEERAEYTLPQASGAPPI